VFHRPIGLVVRDGMALMLMGIATSAQPQGGPPMLTDDPDTPGPGNWEINTAFMAERSTNEHVRSFPHIDVNYGLGDRIQLKYETGFLFVRADDAPAGSNDDRHWRGDLDNSLFGVKWRYFDGGDEGIKASVYPQLEVENPTHSVQRGIAAPAPSLLVPLEISKRFGSIQLVAEFGRVLLRDEPDRWLFGLLAASAVNEDTELLAELHGSFASGLSKADTVLNIGLRQRLTHKLRLLAAAGPGINHGSDSTRFVAYLGIQLLLGSGKR